MAEHRDEAVPEPNRRSELGRRESDNLSSSEDDRVVPGRRYSDYDPRLTITRKAVVVLVVIVDAAYLVGQALIMGHTSCI